jgi:hypothetical protein
MGKLIESAGNSHSHGDCSAVLCILPGTKWGKNSRHLEDGIFCEAEILDPSAIVIFMQ